MAEALDTIESNLRAPLDQRLAYYARKAAAAREAADRAASAPLSEAYLQVALAWLRLAEESKRLRRPIF